MTLAQQLNVMADKLAQQEVLVSSLENGRQIDSSFPLVK